VWSSTDEDRFWTQKAIDAHHNLLDTVQGSAGKWQAAIAAFVGVYATAGFVLGPDKMAALPVHGEPGSALLIAAYAVTGVCGIAAVVLANLAAQGIPEIMTGQPITGGVMWDLTYKRAIAARTQLGWAMRLAAAAGVFAVGISAYLLVAGIAEPGRHDSLVVTTKGAYCGELVDTGGTVELRLPAGTLIPLAGTTVTPVSWCPP